MRKTGKMRRTPSVRPVKKIQVPAKITKGRIALVAGLLAIGLTLIVVSLVKMLTVPAGWQTIQVPEGLEDTCVYEFSLQYLLGETEEKTNREKTAVTDTYVQAAADAYRIFSEKEISGEKNIYYINQNPGQVVKVAPELYAAFRLLQESGSRALYLGPVYENNRALIGSLTDDEADLQDPRANEDVETYYTQALAFIATDEDVKLELLGDNQVRLTISEEYAAFAQEYAIDRYISLDWMRNAFITDYIAEALIRAGHTHGVLMSYDGFTRYLESAGRSYDFNVFDEKLQVATMRFTGVQSVIWLRNYPISLQEKPDYYSWADGRLTGSRLDPADGLDKAACGDLVVYSKNLGCAQVLMQTMDIYVADSLDWTRLTALPKVGVEYVTFQDKVLYASDRKMFFAEPVYDVSYDMPLTEKEGEE